MYLLGYRLILGLKTAVLSEFDVFKQVREI